MSEAISFDYKSFKLLKNNTVSHKLFKTTESVSVSVDKSLVVSRSF